MQRWHDFQAHVGAYLVTNTVFVLIWARHQRGFFWPVYPLVGWGLGLSFQHFSAVLRGQITDRRRAAPAATPSSGGAAAGGSLTSEVISY